jgi:hypothetical protein
MSKLGLMGASLLAIGIGIILFEALAHNNNVHPRCPATLICEYPLPPPEFYIGIFPALAGVILLGISRVTQESPKPIEV